MLLPAAVTWPWRVDTTHQHWCGVRNSVVVTWACSLDMAEGSFSCLPFVFQY